MNLKLFNIAIILRLIPVAIFGIGYAPDSRMLMELSENFNYSHSLMYPVVLSVLGPAGAVSLQIVLDSLTAVMIGSLSLVGGFLYAVSLGPVTYSNYVLTDTLATFFLTVALLGGIKNARLVKNIIMGIYNNITVPNSGRICSYLPKIYTEVVFIGSLICAIFTREIALLLSPLFVWLWWNERGKE